MIWEIAGSAVSLGEMATSLLARPEIKGHFEFAEEAGKTFGMNPETSSSSVRFKKRLGLQDSENILSATSQPLIRAIRRK